MFNVMIFFVRWDAVLVGPLCRPLKHLAGSLMVPRWVSIRENIHPWQRPEG
jgi:hypothetical protein